MKQIISKELLGEVLGIKTIMMNTILEPGNKVGYLVYSSQNTSQEVKNNHKQINIYELAHKCKEWAKSKEFIIHSSPTQKIEYTAIVQSFDFNKFYYGQNQFYALSEYEAIFEACQWILDQRTNQCTEQ